MDILKTYFPELTEKQLQQFAQLQALYKEWNEKINVISRKDIDNLYERHVLHSLAIAKFIQFEDVSVRIVFTRAPFGNSAEHCRALVFHQIFHFHYFLRRQPLVH